MAADPAAGPLPQALASTLGPVPAPPGPGAGAPLWARPWHRRLRDRVVAYLPLLLMALLALATWWLLKNAPTPPPAAGPSVASSEPDYSMTEFALERFGADGRLKLRIEGQRLRHFPAADRIEVERAQLRAIAADGRVTLAQARQALANGDGSELQLLGGAEVTSTDASGQPVVMRSEFLHVFVVVEQVKTHLPVQVLRGDTTLQAAGLSYDNVTQKLELQGPLRTVLPPRAARPAASSPR